MRRKNSDHDRRKREREFDGNDPASVVRFHADLIRQGKFDQARRIRIPMLRKAEIEGFDSPWHDAWLAMIDQTPTDDIMGRLMNPDEEIRKLERLAAQGDALAQAKLEAMRSRLKPPNEWTIYDDRSWTATIFAGRGAGRVISKHSGYVDWWLKYPDGRVVYDWPEAIPKRVKAVVFREANQRPNPDEDYQRLGRKILGEMTPVEIEKLYVEAMRRGDYDLASRMRGRLWLLMRQEGEGPTQEHGELYDAWRRAWALWVSVFPAGRDLDEHGIERAP